LLPEIPHERLVSYTKGCYPGQEVVVRIRDRGHVNRRLTGLVLEGDVVPPGGADVLADGAAVGRVTSATWSLGLGRPIALAFVRREHAEPGRAVAVRVGGRTVAARIAALPVGSVKVHREERPDVDQIYMQAVQSMTGHGAWPMTCFLTPHGEPFYGGTYFPPVERHGLPAFPRLLQALADAWANRRGEVTASARQLGETLAQADRLRSSTQLLTDEILFTAFQALSAQFDEKEGGLGGAPKFPQPMLWEFVLRFWRRAKNARARQMAHTTLTMMARGGIYDQVGGGFHRYSVD